MIAEEVGGVLLQTKLKIQTGKEKYKELKIDPTLNWQIAEIISLNENKFEF